MRYVKRMPFDPSAVSGLVTVQIGSFKEETNASRLKQGMDFNYNDVHITPVLVNGEKFYRVRIGKFKNYDNAYAVAEKLADEGYNTLITSKELNE
jgi:rare lipoprotein A